MTDSALISGWSGCFKDYLVDCKLECLTGSLLGGEIL